MVADGGSGHLINALVLHGSLDDIAARLHAHLDAGADHIAIEVLGPNIEDPLPAYRKLAESLR
jgi:2-methylisocitrate lyase-like PEP mutase family enzyme